jgi:hypothetical protein
MWEIGENEQEEHVMYRCTGEHQSSQHNCQGANQWGLLREPVLRSLYIEYDKILEIPVEFWGIPVEFLGIM